MKIIKNVEKYISTEIAFIAPSRMGKNQKQSRYPTRNKGLVRNNMIKPGG